MIKIRCDKNSIVFKLMFFVVCLIVGQTVLLVATMTVAGVLYEAEENAYQSFFEKVDNKKSYIEREMSNRWTKFSPYLHELSNRLPLEKNEQSREQFLKEAAPILISMLRTTMTTGTFILLNGQLDDFDNRSSLYFRDYDPLLNNDDNKDLYYVAGPFEISRMLKIPMDHNWAYNLKLTEKNRTFYDMPNLKVPLSTNSNLLGYWTKPFCLTPDDLPIVTYSMPIFDRNNEPRGIIGVEVSVDYFKRLLTATDLFPRDSLGYLIGYKGEDDKGIRPIIINGALQERMIKCDEDFILLSKDEKRGIYQLENHNSQDNIYASIRKMGLYYHNTPFEQEEWYLIGLMGENKLLSFVNKIKDILMISFLGSIVISGAGGYFISYIVTKPIIHLAKQVRESDVEKNQSLTRTGLTEIDDLSRAIETANKNLLESTLKLSQIIDLVELSIGAFEYKEKEEKVFATDQLKEVLQFNENEVEELYNSKELFIKRLNRIMERAEPEEENVYKLSESPEYWVRINMVVIEDSTTFGIVIDVTDEIKEKNQIKLDRDHDNLTKIYNRGAYEREVSKLLKEGRLNVGAFIMFDLDYLKLINDSYGHKWGDLYITTTADFLSEFENSGIIGRMAGDEFSVFLYGFDSKNQIREIVERFYEKLKSHAIIFPEGERKISISAGLYWLDQDENNYHFDEVFQKADRALYQAKNKDKGTYFEYDGIVSK